MKLPAFPRVSARTLHTIAERHRLASAHLRAAPWLLVGHRSIAPLDNDPSAEARVLWRHLQLALLVLRRGPLPDRSWADRPLSMPLEIMRFLVEAPPGPWRSLLP